MQLKVNKLIDHCLAAISDLDLDEDMLLAWLETLDALERNVDLTKPQLEKVEKLLRQELAPRARVLLTRILIFRADGMDAVEFLRPYLNALVYVSTRDSMAGEVLRVFHAHHKHAAQDIWHACVEVLGLDEAVRLLAGMSVTDLPDDAARLLEEEARMVHRSGVIWDFVMVATPLAWRHPGARRPDSRTRYWHALVDWPYDGTGRNSRPLVADGIATDREAEILEGYGARLRAHLNQYDSTPSQATLVADANLEALGSEALHEFFGVDFQRILRAMYCSAGSEDRYGVL